MNYPATITNNYNPNSPPASSVPYQGTIPSTGQAITENGLQPGAQVTVMFVNTSGTPAWTTDQISAVENNVTQGLQQAWPGPPYGDPYPPPIFFTSSTFPATDPVTGWAGASADNVTSVMVSCTNAQMQQLTPPDADNIVNGDTHNTNDGVTGYTTSSYSFVGFGLLTDPSSPSQQGNLGEHEEMVHGLLNLTDSTAPNSLTNGSSTEWPPDGFSPSDLKSIHSIIENPTPPPAPPPPPQC